LLHLWSLGVEEQFYLIWPITLVLIWRFRRYRTVIVILAAIISLAVSSWSAATNPDAAFYSPLSRFWELLIGAMLAIMQLRRGDIRSWLTIFRASEVFPNIVASTGLALIVGSVFLLDQAMAFPGWRALAPTVGTALVISAGPGVWLNRWLLSNRSLVFVGLISYPLYLWHWPLLSLIVINRSESVFSPRILTAIALVLTVVAATITYRYLELPLRRLNLRRTAGTLTVIMVMMVVVGASVSIADGLPQRYNGTARELIDNFTRESGAAGAAYRYGICLLDVKSKVDFPDKCSAGITPTIVLWGDSHAAHLYPGLVNLFSNPEQNIAQYTQAACPPVLDFKYSPRTNCSGMNERIANIIKANPPKILILAADWIDDYDTPGFIPLLQKTIDHVKSSGTTVILFGPVVTFLKPQWHFLIGRSSREDMVPNSRLPNMRKVDEMLRVLAREENVKYVSSISSLCTGDRCRVLVPGGPPLRLFAWDLGHLTRDGSKYYVHAFIEPEIERARPGAPSTGYGP
jgi:hypothetical protein